MYERRLTSLIAEALADTPVVLVQGPRQSGKSTLVQRLARTTHPATYVTLDDLGQLAAAKDDPVGFLRRFAGPLAIDEVQRVPDLLLAIKAEVDRDRRPGRFLLTGSANALTVPKASESLAGRMEVHRLSPLSQAEIAGSAGNFIDRMLAGEVPRLEGELTRGDLLELALRGGFPEAVERPAPRRRQAWFQGYLNTVIQRDLRDLARIEGLTDLPRLLQILAARSAGLLNRSGLARDTGLTERTLGRYLSLLQASFLIDELPAWARNVTKRLTKSPKLLLADTGLMAHLLRIHSVEDAEREAGALMESFVATEILKLTSWSETPVECYHYRTYPGREVDLVLQHGPRSLVGLAVKCSATVTASDFAGLRDLAEAAGDDLVTGAVLYTGRSVVPFGGRFWALPVEVLWRSET